MQEKKQVDQGFILWFLGHHTSKECTCICIFVTWMIFPWEHNPVTSMSLKTSSHVVGKTGLQSPYSIAVELNQWIDCRGLHNSDQEHYLTLSYDSLAWIKQVIINYLCSNKGPHCKNINMRKTILSCFHIFCNILIVRLYAYKLITEWPQKCSWYPELSI